MYHPYVNLFDRFRFYFGLLFRDSVILTRKTLAKFKAKGKFLKPRKRVKKRFNIASRINIIVNLKLITFIVDCSINFQ